MKEHRDAAHFQAMTNKVLAYWCENWQLYDGSKVYDLASGASASNEAFRRINKVSLTMLECAKELRKLDKSEYPAPGMRRVKDLVADLNAAHSNDWPAFQNEMNEMTHLELKCVLGELYGRFQYMNGEK
jgi:hypothetical protein